MQDAFVARDRRRDQEVKLKPARTTIATQQSQLTDTLTVGRHRVRPFSGDGACTKRNDVGTRSTRDLAAANA